MEASILEKKKEKNDVILTLKKKSEKMSQNNLFVFSNVAQISASHVYQQKDLAKIYQMLKSIFYSLLNKDAIYLSQTYDFNRIYFREDKSTNFNYLLSIFASIFVSTRTFFDFNCALYDHLTLDDIFKIPFLESIYEICMKMDNPYLKVLNEKLCDAWCIDLKKKLIRKIRDSTNEVLNESEFLLIHYIYKIAIQTHLFNAYCGKNNNLSLRNIDDLKLLFEASNTKSTLYCTKLNGDLNEENIENFRLNIDNVCKTSECEDVIFFYFYDLYEKRSDINEINNEPALFLKIEKIYKNIRENIFELIEKLNKQYIENRKLCIDIMFYLNLGEIEKNPFEEIIANLKMKIEKLNVEKYEIPDVALEYDIEITSTFKIDVLDSTNSLPLPVFSFLQYRNDIKTFDIEEFDELQIFLKEWEISFNNEKNLKEENDLKDCVQEKYNHKIGNDQTDKKQENEFINPLKKK
ncbi:hypothetical protein GVAV_001619 [Gurleya vavrai]